MGKEELANTVTHGAGLALSAVGWAALLVLGILRGSAWRIVACGVYGFTLVLLYAASTMYHAASSPRFKRALKVIDHSSIFLLIAGTYTPFTLVSLRGHWGWTLFGLVWGLSVSGILLKAFFVDRFKVASTALYLATGWLGLIAFKPLATFAPTGAVLWLLAGGVLYTAGMVFYGWRKLPYHHAIWHVFVLAARACHYLAVLHYVLPAKA